MPPRAVRTLALAPLSERTGISPKLFGPDRDRVVYLDSHVFEALVKINAVRGSVECSTGLHAARRVVIDDGRRRDASACANDNRRRQWVAG